MGTLINKNQVGTSLSALAVNHDFNYSLKGVYQQSNVSLAMIDIDASKGFVNLWVHLSFAIIAIFDLKGQLKLLEMAFDQVQTCLIFPFRWAHFPIKNSRKVQWVHPFFDEFQWLSISLPIF